MAQLPTRVCVFNTTATPQAPALPPQTGSNLIDIITAVDGSLVPTPGPSAAGVPVVLNPSGLIDPTLTHSGTLATADVGGVSSGNLVTLYVPPSGPNVGKLMMQPATASPTGVGITPPTPAEPFPYPALGFVTSLIIQNVTGTVNFAGTFNYNDPISEFSTASIGMQVYLADSGDGQHSPGAITLSPPSGVGTLKQTVGFVTDYNSGIVTVNFVPAIPQSGSVSVSFDHITSGVNVAATMTVGTGATMTFSGTGVLNANQLTGDPVNTSGRTTGQALVWSGTQWAPSSAGTT